MVHCVSAVKRLWLVLIDHKPTLHIVVTQKLELLWPVIPSHLQSSLVSTLYFPMSNPSLSFMFSFSIPCSKPHLHYCLPDSSSSHSGITSLLFSCLVLLFSNVTFVTPCQLWPSGPKSGLINANSIMLLKCVLHRLCTGALPSVCYISDQSPISSQTWPYCALLPILLCMYFYILPHSINMHLSLYVTLVQISTKLPLVVLSS